MIKFNIFFINSCDQPSGDMKQAFLSGCDTVVTHRLQDHVTELEGCELRIHDLVEYCASTRQCGGEVGDSHVDKL